MLDKELLRQEQRIIELDDFILSCTTQLNREKEFLEDLNSSLSAQGDAEKKINKRDQIQTKIDDDLSFLRENNEKISSFLSKYSQKENLEKTIKSSGEIKESILSQIQREKDYFDR